jgi:hypothetical protein
LHLPPGRRDKLAGLQAQSRSIPPKVNKSSKVKRAENQRPKKPSKTSAIRVDKNKKLPKPADNKKLIVVDFETPDRSTPQAESTAQRTLIESEDIAVRRAPITIEIDEDNLISPAPDAGASNEVELQQ